jgi:nucleotide-binding universal stress UspA family protein
MGPAVVREVLVATDFSETANTAVRVARASARAFGARLHVVHVAWADNRELDALFARFLGDLGTTGPIAVVSLRGDAPEEIVRYAKVHGIDLIVLGVHGRTGVSPAVIGSVAERVVRTAPCPVLTVPHPSPGEEARVLPPSAQHCVACNALSRDLVCEACRARLRGQHTYAGRPGTRAGPYAEHHPSPAGD